jgi:hypothetical protein
LRSLEINAAAMAGNQSIDLNSPADSGAFRSVRIYAADLNAAKMSLYSAIANANSPTATSAIDGIYDSALPAHPGSRVGIAITTDAHGDANVLIRPTRIGDVNLDGLVTIADFIDLAAHFNLSGLTWQEGDLNYDGTVTIADFIDLASNFNTSYGGPSSAISDQDRIALASFAQSHGVPEPALGGFILVAAGLLGRKRRR